MQNQTNTQPSAKSAASESKKQTASTYIRHIDDPREGREGQKIQVVFTSQAKPTPSRILGAAVSISCIVLNISLLIISAL